MLIALAAAPAAIALLSAAVPPLAPNPSPSPSPTLDGTLMVTKTDEGGNIVTVPGATFNIHENTPDGPIVGIPITTTASGTKTRMLRPGTYCLEETAAPPGFQVAPTYITAQCQAVITNMTTSFRVADPPAATPTPSASPTAIPSPTPSPTPPPTGELQITKTDTSGQTITTPGFTFNIRVGSTGGQVIATIATDGSGMAVAGALNPATYCVEEVSAPDGYQLAPAYSPNQCVNVASDSTQGHSPTLVSVADPPSSSPTPSAAAVVTPSPSAAPSARAVQVTAPPSSPAAALARGLIGVGALLLLAGAVMIAIAIRRRRRRPPAGPPPRDYRYDSTVG